MSRAARPDRRGLRSWQAVSRLLSPGVLDRPLYHADGQQRDEVYNWGSFLQSKMYANGVTCSDCHNPHSGKLRAEGNALCATCHLPSKYDTAAHHHHKPASAGAACVGCHMPSATYMVVDPRHDHSLRMPRPDLSVKLGTPNACNGCHTNRDARWAAAQMTPWYGHAPQGFQRFAEAFCGRDCGRARCAGATARDRRRCQPSRHRPRHSVGGIECRRQPTRARHLGGGLRDRSPLLRLARAPVARQRAARHARIAGGAAARRSIENATYRGGALVGICPCDHLSPEQRALSSAPARSMSPANDIMLIGAKRGSISEPSCESR